MGVPGELWFFLGHIVKNWDCPEKSGTDGHLTWWPFEQSQNSASIFAAVKLTLPFQDDTNCCATLLRPCTMTWAVNMWLNVRCSYEAAQLSHLRRHLETHEVQKRFACSHCDYSANTASYLKMHQTRQHPPNSTSAPTIITRWHGSGSGLQCHVCHYRFGNTSDLKRHAKLRHGIDPPQHTAISNTAAMLSSPALLWFVKLYVFLVNFSCYYSVPRKSENPEHFAVATTNLILQAHRDVYFWTNFIVWYKSTWTLLWSQIFLT